MNSLGRHYRDPSNPDDPTCSYETANGAKCTFFQDGGEFVNLPYPEDITFGPLPLSVDEGVSEQSAILIFLQEQKKEADLHRQTQTEQMNRMQEQINSLLSSSREQPVTGTSSTPVQTHGSATMSQPSVTFSLPTAPTRTTPSTSRPQPTSFPQTSRFPLPSGTPSNIAQAAATLNAFLSSGSAANNFGFQGLNMDHLRKEPQCSAQAERILGDMTQNVHPLSNLLGRPPQTGNQSQVNVDQLLRATIVNKQVRTFEFAQSGQFSYSKSIKKDNINAVAFAFGAFKHLEAVKNGLIPMNDEEFLSRLRHLRNVFEIACLSSSLDSFSCPSWLIAREYDSRVINDIESGSKYWETLSNGIEPDSIYCAKETISNRPKPKKPKESGGAPKDDKKKKACTTYNSHRSSEGCFWESKNEGESCVFEHSCSWCKTNRGVNEKHKAYNCPHKDE